MASWCGCGWCAQLTLPYLYLLAVPWPGTGYSPACTSRPPARLSLCKLRKPTDQLRAAALVQLQTGPGHAVIVCITANISITWGSSHVTRVQIEKGSFHGKSMTPGGGQWRVSLPCPVPGPPSPDLQCSRQHKNVICTTAALHRLRGAGRGRYPVGAENCHPAVHGEECRVLAVAGVPRCGSTKYKLIWASQQPAATWPPAAASILISGRGQKRKYDPFSS